MGNDYKYQIFLPHYIVSHIPINTLTFCMQNFNTLTFGMQDLNPRLPKEGGCG